MLDALQSSDVPMDRVALYEALTRRGIVIGGGDRVNELNALSARVYRMALEGAIVNQPGKGYRLKRADEGPRIVTGAQTPAQTDNAAT